MGYAALLVKNSRVIGLVCDAPAAGNTIAVAGCFTADGDPVNVRSYRISRAVRNMAAAQFEQPLSRVGGVYTFHAV